MVAQFPGTGEIQSKSQLPKIDITVNTFIEYVSTDNPQRTDPQTRMCIVSIKVENVQKSLAIATFTRIFDYVQNLANNDINPMGNVNVGAIADFSTFAVTKPETGVILSIDSSQAITVCTLALNIANLRLDYMDEYFSRTLTYLTNAIANDLNP